MNQQILEIWNYKGFWLGTVMEGSCATITLQLAARRWNYRVDGGAVCYCSRDWNFTREAARKFHQDAIAGKLFMYPIGFDEWNEVAKKWHKPQAK